MLKTDALPAGTLAALIKIMQTLALSDRILVGGTGLALYKGHRLSVDIDLFSPNPVEPFIIVPELEAIGKVTVLANTNISLHLLFDNIKVDVVKYGYEWIRPIHKENDIRLASLEDIGAMKLAAVTNRGSKKDFYDIYFLLQEHTLQSLLNWFEEKFPNWNLLLVLKSLTYFEDAEQTEQPVVIGKKVSWGKVKQVISKAVVDYHF